MFQSQSTIFTFNCKLQSNVTLAFYFQNATLAFSHDWLSSNLNWEIQTLMGSRLVPTPFTNLRDYLTRKRSVHQITPQYHCERLISVVFSDCHCDFQVTRPLIFSQLSKASTTSSAKRRCSCKKNSFSDFVISLVNNTVLVFFGFIDNFIYDLLLLLSLLLLF